MKFHTHKIQCVLTDKKKEEELKKELDVLKTEHQGSLLLITARGTRREIMEKIQAKILFLRSAPTDSGRNIYQRNGGGRL